MRLKPSRIAMVAAFALALAWGAVQLLEPDAGRAAGARPRAGPPVAPQPKPLATAPEHLRGADRAAKPLPAPFSGPGAAGGRGAGAAADKNSSVSPAIVPDATRTDQAAPVPDSVPPGSGGD